VAHPRLPHAAKRTITGMAVRRDVLDDHAGGVCRDGGAIDEIEDTLYSAGNSSMRDFIGTLLIKAGMAVLPAETKELVRGILLYHVPGMLSENEKADIRAAKSEWEHLH
jgi:hypothetical protein